MYEKLPVMWLHFLGKILNLSVRLGQFDKKGRWRNGRLQVWWVNFFAKIIEFMISS